ncbi:hypothetical protein KNV96_19240, partial [Chryseobacterium indologenes]
IYESNESYISSKVLVAPESIPIRVGIAGGMPNNSVTGDIVSGCLSAKQACYGICFAAKGFWGQGIDFGIRRENILDIDLIKKDLDVLPKSQRYLRNGWNSDPSWNWDKANKLAEILMKNNILTIFISKVFTKPSKEVMLQLVSNRAEIRVSISAMDNNAQLKTRLEFIQEYRNLGGIVIPIIMSASYNIYQLKQRQDNIVNWLVEKDFLIAENSLRFPMTAAVTQLIDLSKTKPVYNSNDVWSGRLYEDKAIFPTTTSIPDTYSGISTAYSSKFNKHSLSLLFVDPVKTHAEVMSHSGQLMPPAKCGIAEMRMETSNE